MMVDVKGGEENGISRICGISDAVSETTRLRLGRKKIWVWCSAFFLFLYYILIVPPNFSRRGPIGGVWTSVLIAMGTLATATYGAIK
jgi:hypothetical protein